MFPAVAVRCRTIPEEAIIATQAPINNSSLVSTGIPGLDEIFKDGLVPNRLYLVEGAPGSGKTTLALQFLLEGVKRGEPCMFVTLSESKHELEASAAAHGWTLAGIHVLEIAASEKTLQVDAPYTMFHPSDVELSETVTAVLAEADRIKPARLVFDSLSELRLLSENSLRYRRQILALKRHFQTQQSTVVFIDDRTGTHKDMDLHSLAHGVISLERSATEYGTIRRHLQVNKLRGHAFLEGVHDFVIRSGGLCVYPRLVAAGYRTDHERGTVKSGLAQLDQLLCGGLARGTSTLIMGAVGTGKSSLATQFAVAAALRGEQVSVFLFEEGLTTFLERSAGLGMDIAGYMKAGRIKVRPVDTAELSPGEFAHEVRRAVSEGSRMVIIDSLSGYLNAMPSEQFLLLHLRELLSYMANQGVTSLLLMAQYGVVGNLQTPLDASYIADTVLLLRYFEAFGEVRQAISVIKKRTGRHERTIREMRLDDGISIGEPLREFQGVLTGLPMLTGPGESTMAASAK